MLIRLPDGSAPHIDPTAWIAPNATLAGNVTLSAEASVWYGAVLRGEFTSITIGSRSNVQDNCSLHVDHDFPVVIGAGVSIGHNAVVHGCTIEDGCLIGMGATVLNGAVVGAGSLVAANALIPQGMIIPPGSLVAGVPGKVRRPLTSAETVRLQQNAATYVELAGTHRAAVID